MKSGNLNFLETPGPLQACNGTALPLRKLRGAGIAQSVSDSLRAGRYGYWNPVGGEIIRARPDRHRGPPSLLYNGYRVFPGGKLAGEWRWPPTPSSAEVKERVELYIYSPFGPLWPALRWTLHKLPVQCEWGVSVWLSVRIYHLITYPMH